MVDAVTSVLALTTLVLVIFEFGLRIGQELELERWSKSVSAEREHLGREAKRALRNR